MVSRLGIILLLFASTVSCSTDATPGRDGKNAERGNIIKLGSVAKTKNAIVEAIPIASPIQQRKVFGVNFRKIGILPVFVKIENTGTRPLLVRGSDMMLRTAEGLALVPAPISLVSSQAKLSRAGLPPGGGGATGLLGLSILALEAIEETKRAKERGKVGNWLERSEFGDEVIEMKVSQKGFVYFRSNKRWKMFSNTKVAKLMVRIIEKDTRESELLALPLVRLNPPPPKMLPEPIHSKPSS